MSTDLPIKVKEYLLDQISPKPDQLLIKVNKDRKILQWKGQPEHYIQKELIQQDCIEDVVPALTDIIPLESTSIKLSKIQLVDNKYTDIHIIKDKDDYWILFMDQTKEVDSLKTLLQKMNEQELMETSSNQYSNPFAHADKLNYSTFKRDDERNFQLLLNIPLWLKSHPLFKADNNSIDLLQAFPFLEVFFYEADDLWSDQGDSYIVSETWSETFANKKHYLRAFATNFNNENYLFIKSFVREGVEEQNLLQAYRDNALAYDKLEKTERKLKELLDYKNKFNSIISHDLRAPISAVLGVVNLISEDAREIAKLNPDYQELLLGIKDEMLRLLDYNNKLYHWANLELGNFNLEITELSLKEMLEIAENTARGQCAEKNIKLSIILKNDIKFEADKTLFLQVLNNLLSNAVKFTPQGNEIVLFEKKHKKNVVIVVQDTGVGMYEETVKNLFKESLRNTTLGTSGEKGTGLGLGIVKKIIDALGFTIDVESKPGVGSTFFIEIPEQALV